MSLVRFASPGHPTILVDQGPAIGRRSVSRLGIRGGGPPVITGAFVTGEGQRSRDLRLQREAGARSRAGK